MKPLATAGRTADAAKAEEFDLLKRKIHNKLVDKLDLNRVGELQGDVLRREIRLVVEHSTYVIATSVVVLAAVASAAVIRERIDKLDLVAVLKTRD